ncbi:HTH-type transcriptional regulator DegA [Pseudovibrio axinellae]|uniref:HTH-type transcriptional regulator DegA n=1 Tax=Pseudovibrio axinellae TaxID=989403 RepID=A0A165ZFN7_9HYPH|nr:LacI family DNA-binding transcriptional regulator [Pseudovibrio axinellae]KZL19842.1 HTH-type transcriptional regulator DegA [Pseudovibrio axinellae]SER39489.1 transcriptional regulator, LacI family [Pseudovibrio axinellae]
MSEKVSSRKQQVRAVDVARHAGVSRVSVSRTFTPGASVSASTRAKVLKSAEILGYHVNRLASSLNRSESGIVALIAAEIETPHRATMIAELSEKLQAAGKVTMLINTSGYEERVQDALLQAISFRTEAAIILSGAPDPSLADTCFSNGMKLVLINREEDFPGSLQIGPDNKAAGRTAFNALLRAGCQRIALSNSSNATSGILEREEGFLEAAVEAGVNVICEVAGVTSYKAGLEIGTRLMDREDRPDGVFCTTDLIACGVIDAARQRFGLRTPEDLSVIGFDNIPQAEWEGYNLTTFAQPTDLIIDKCLEWCTTQQPSTEAVKLPARFVWRNSVQKVLVAQSQ